MLRFILPAISLMLFAPTVLLGQNEVWLKVDAGTVQFLSPGDREWMPALERQQLPQQAFLLTDPGTRAQLFHAAEAYPVPADSYFFIGDMLPRTRLELVEALTRIEATQLPSHPQDDRDAPRTVGLTYGAPSGNSGEVAGEIPFNDQRRRAIAFFLEHDRFDAALLSLKRTMTRFPDWYADETNVELLLDLYDRFQLYGFIVDECDRLMGQPQTEPVADVLRQWREVAEGELAVVPR